ncbi:MAG TPA: carbon-nitrogen hydrolase family protein [Pyrinomonadaceae bacterium]|jgi:predicted amidohydrolase|nr:carbon-nitrogen hydrolase family protein [Pyrinomonadaceae bacterium]
MTRVAAIQASPIYMNLARSLEKADALIKEAASQDAQLVVFSETWLPGYPAWLDCCRDMGLWDHEPTKRLYARLAENSVVVPGPITNILGSAARENSIVLNISVHERVAEGPGRGTLYNSMLTFESDGTLLNCHRKIMPTFTERIIWGQGDGASLHAVETSVGRVGGLICWEHWMPLARQALHMSGEDIHIAAWPWVKDMNLIACRQYAFEGRCFVIASGGLMRARDLPEELEPIAEYRESPDALVLKGGTTIIAPDGGMLAGPVVDEETIVMADLDLSQIKRESMALDVTGHYSRPDIFEFKRTGGR